jgi:hypothetical protein
MYGNLGLFEIDIRSILFIAREELNIAMFLHIVIEEHSVSKH